MKSIKNSLIGLATIGGLIALAGFIQAQVATVPVQSISSSAGQSDSVVQIAADSQGLILVPPDQLPKVGTFWVFGNNLCPAPYPCPPSDPNAIYYAIGPSGIFLVDATDGAVPHPTGIQALRGVSSSTFIQEQLDSVLNLIGQVQGAQANQLAQAMGMGVPSPGDDGSTNGGDGYSPMFSSSYSIDTNGLWLEITNVSNGWSYLNLHNGTNQVYAIWSTTNLSTPFANWQVETEVWPTNGTVIPTVTPFTVQNFNRQYLFLRAEDWTGVYTNGLPAWWIWWYFGNLSETATNLDGQGNTLLYDYQNGFDPNVVSFNIWATNRYANSYGAAVQVTVNYGVPSYFAVLVDDANHADATWNTYTSSNITVNLGSTEGWHQVYVGMRGLPTNAYQTWQTIRLKLDLTPPLLVITNPAPGTVTQPVLQLQGYCPETLASLTYDLNNAAGLVTNQQAIILDQYFDTNVLDFTTNYFQCFDVPLTNGQNIITLHATDLAGNITTTNFTYTLDYSSATNPPTVQLDWPQSGTQISGSSFTARGSVSDPTARVIAQIVDTNGVTNSVSGQVGRNGDFWVADVLLSGGTNNLTLTVTDSAGNVSVTSIPVIQSSLVLTITSASLGGAVTGTISDPADYTIWVNGTMATNNGDGTWTAQDPHLTLDTPTVQVRAIPNSDNGGYGGGQ
jgi:hypothetical protein